MPLALQEKRNVVDLIVGTFRYYLVVQWYSNSYKLLRVPYLIFQFLG